MGDVIEKVEAREILGGTGRPTVEARVVTRGGFAVEASVPAGTSKGKHEAFELYDGGTRYRGRGVRRAVESINRIIAPALRGMEVEDQRRIDDTLIRLDGTENKEKLGGNAVLAVSVACAKAGAAARGIPVFRHLGSMGMGAPRIPAPMITVIAGGSHSPSPLPFEDYLLIFGGFSSFPECAEAVVETRIRLGEIVGKKFGTAPEVGGALAPPVADTRQAFDLMLQAASESGFAGKLTLGLDVAANEFYVAGNNVYDVGEEMTADALIQTYRALAKEYPLTYIEDAFHEDDHAHFAELTRQMPGVSIVGDDLYASNPRRIAEGIRMKAGNGVLLKINQIGSVSEALDAAALAVKNGFEIHVSLRSNETNDDFVADFAVAVGGRQAKLGSPFRGEKTAKYNRLFRIEEEMNAPSPSPLPRRGEGK
ncbi:MAG TPA: enolase C-terminal domain-like protein [Thermodesulfobacteriota bacterium]|nr:enolase C-terminal domain-like protein [Thermodesulfobacteriota bacterium]